MRSRLALLALAIGSLSTILACGTSDSSNGDSTTTSANGGDAGGPTQSVPPPGDEPGTPDSGLQTPGTTEGTCGAGKAPCADGLPCGGAADCTSGVCAGGICQVPSGGDGVKNGDETDVDCGGATAKKCDVGQSCKTYADCNDDCDPGTLKCVVGKSCWQHGGGAATCGATEAATGNCCERATVAGSTVQLDKYQVTAGRMRGMIERLNGDVLSFVKTLPSTKWNQAWNGLVPGDVDSANNVLGPYFYNAPNDPDRTTDEGAWSKYSCQVEDGTGHTYKVPDDGSVYTQAQMDPKALNCVGWHMAQAFCAWEGGRLPTADELSQAITNNGTTRFPWGGTDDTASPFGPDDDHAQQSHYGNHAMNYEYPEVPKNGYAKDGNPKDMSCRMAPPGRFPDGNNQAGMSDLLGDMIPWVWEVDKKGKPLETSFGWTDSWEYHTEWWATDPKPSKGKTGRLMVQQWNVDHNPNEPNGYYAIGFRCAYDPK